MAANDPYPWSAGFRSLAEEHSYRLDDIEGDVPAGLRGTLFRNGSGRNALGGKWFAHWFDGDGMILAIRFDDQGIHFQNRYVETRNYRDETRAGRILYRGFGKMVPGGLLANAFRPLANVSNTSVVMEYGRLLSLWEGGPPMALDPASLRTLGMETFNGSVGAFSAHPKVDPETGDLFNFGIDYSARSTLTPYRLSKGIVTRLAAIDLPYPVMNHDFVLTRNHLVFCLGPIVVASPLKVLLGLRSFDGALRWDTGRPTLIVLVPRHGGGKPRIVETEPFFQFHFANGFEEDGELTMDLARYPDYLTIGQALRTFWQSDWPSQGMACLTRLRLDLATGEVASRTYDTGLANEFPTINPKRTGHRHRYAYILCNPADRLHGLQQQIAKVDLEGGAVRRHDFGPDRYPGEPLFIAIGEDGEDDGVIVTIVFDAARQRSELVCLDARDPTAAPIFVARLKHHVPFGLHGTFTPRLF
jgi:all-trans-8'-apo-beta-carotenal 15,15'-oxygenase